MREVCVFSSEINVAIGKNATQSSDLNDSVIASPARFPMLPWCFLMTKEMWFKPKTFKTLVTRVGLFVTFPPLKLTVCKSGSCIGGVRIVKQASCLDSIGDLRIVAIRRK